MRRRKFLLYSTVAVLTGCTATTVQQPDESSSSRGAAVNKPQMLRFAVSDVKGMEDLKKDYEAVRQVLEDSLGMKVEFFPVDSYTAAAAALQLGQVDLVFTGPSEYVVMHARTNAQPVVAVQRQDYYALVAVPAGSPIKTLKDLKGKKVAMWEVGSTSGHLGPTKLLMDAGLNPKTDVQIEMLAKQGMEALKAGKVDAWAGSLQKFEQYRQKANLSQTDVVVIAKGPLLPADVFILNSKLDAALVQEIRDRLLQNQDKVIQALGPADGNKYVGAKMIAAQDSDYDGIRAVYQAIGQGAFLQS